MSQSAERSLIRSSDNCSLGDVYILLLYIIDMHRRHCNLGHRAMGRVVFLPRSEIRGTLNSKIILLNKIFMSAPKWDGLILAWNGALAY